MLFFKQPRGYTQGLIKLNWTAKLNRQPDRNTCDPSREQAVHHGSVEQAGCQTPMQAPRISRPGLGTLYFSNRCTIALLDIMNTEPLGIRVPANEATFVDR
jgi:hypothetical protein